MVSKTSLSVGELRTWLEAGVEAARRGAAVLESWRGRFQIREKAWADLVSEADEASQQTIREFLLSEFPQHRFLGEEDCVGKSGAEIRPPADAPPTWVVDPLDGTSNYCHDVPMYCVSIGLLVGGEGVLGVVHDPRLGETFTAARGMGAYLNGQRIRVSGIRRLSEAMLATGFPANVERHLRNLEVWRRLAGRAQSIHRTGSTALNLAYVACGRFDGYWGHDNYPWDVMAGAVLIEEAGGRVTNADATPFDPFRPDMLATNGLIHDELAPSVPID